MMDKLIGALCNNGYLMQSWVRKLDLKKQSSLIAALRGNDADNGTCVKCKEVTRMLRYLIVNNIGKRSSYMSDAVMNRNNVVKLLTNKYPTNRHWVKHVIDASYIIGNGHPSSYVRDYWLYIAKTLNYRMKEHDKKQRALRERELFVNSVIDKYINIYTTRYV